MRYYREFLGNICQISCAYSVDYFEYKMLINTGRNLHCYVVAWPCLTLRSGTVYVPDRLRVRTSFDGSAFFPFTLDPSAQ